MSNRYPMQTMLYAKRKRKKNILSSIIMIGGILGLSVNTLGHAADVKMNFTVNFKPPTTTVEAGFDPVVLEDHGKAYGNRGGGFKYGWNQENTVNMRERLCEYDVMDITLAYMQTDTGGNEWEIKVPNGRYRVNVRAGDCIPENSRYKIDVEGVRVVNDDNQLFPYTEGTAEVTVRDGKLTVSNGAGAVNNKITTIAIKRLLASRSSTSVVKMGAKTRR